MKRSTWRMIAAGCVASATFAGGAEAQTISTLTVRNQSQVPVKCSLGKALFAVAPGAQEVRPTYGESAGACNEGAFRLNTLTPTHFVRCLPQGKGVRCGEDYDPQSPPPAPPTVEVQNDSNVDVRCTFTPELTFVVPAGMPSAMVLSGASPATCSYPGGSIAIPLSPAIRAHSVRCVTSGKGVSCAELPVTPAPPPPKRKGASGTPAPEPVPLVPKTGGTTIPGIDANGRSSVVSPKNPRISTTSPLPIACKFTRADGIWSTATATEQAATTVAIEDEKTQAMSVECSTSEWKKFGVWTGYFPAPHTAPMQIVCTKGAAAGDVVCAAK